MTDPAPAVAPSTAPPVGALAFPLIGRSYLRAGRLYRVVILDMAGLVYARSGGRVRKYTLAKWYTPSRGDMFHLVAESGPGSI